MISQDARESAARLKEALELMPGHDHPHANGWDRVNAWLVHVARNHLRTLLAEHDARQWRGMDSAPRDGTWILAWAQRGKYQTLRWYMSVDGWHDYNGHRWAPQWWMPLPEVPRE